MDEQKTEEKVEREETPRTDENTNDGISTEEEENVESPIEEAKKILTETKETLKSITSERKKIEKATAEMLVNGRSMAGIGTNKTKEQKMKEEAKDFWKGTAIADAIDKQNE